MSSIAGVLIATSLLLGQTEQTSAYQHLKGLEWLVGHAVGDYTIPDGWDASAPVGTKVVRRSSTRWALDKSILYIELSETAEGRRPEEWLEIIGWDPEKEQIVHWILSPGGGSGSGVWSNNGGEWQLKWTSQYAGAKYSGTGRMRETGKDTFTWGITDATKDGKAIADIPVTQCTKTDTAQASGLPESRLEFLEGLVGEWAMEGTSEGDKVTAEIEIQWAAHRHCLEYRGTWNMPDRQASFSGLAGWNPAKKEVVFTEYWSGGGYSTLRYPAGTPHVLEGKMAGVDDEGLATGGQIRLAINGPDEFVFTAKKAFRGDQAQPDSKLVFRRR